MWTCHKCNSEVEDDSYAFCWNCNEQRIDEISGWICSKCNTSGNDISDEFCANCGQSKEIPNSSATTDTPLASSIKPVAQPEVIPSASLSIQPIVPTTPPLVYDSSVFATQFPQWDLQPPVVTVRRVLRSI